MPKHIANIDVRGDLRVRGRYRDGQNVAGAVVADGFYLRGVGEIGITNACFTHDQPSASVEWTVNHGMDTNDLVAQAYDTNDRLIQPDEVDISSTSVTFFYFAEAQAGKAILVACGGPGGGGITTFAGPDGLVYANDSTRDGKRLSISRTTLSWSRTGTANANRTGFIVKRGNSNLNTSSVMPRPGTITWVGGSSTEVIDGEISIDVRAYVDGEEPGVGAGTRIHALQFYIDPDWRYHSRKLNVDIEANETIGVLLDSSSGGGMSNPVVDVEIAWRDDT
jgi:hypothetical protein